jgi:arylsulfatase A-like enzyme
MKRRDFLKTTAAAPLGQAAMAQSTTSQARPNILVLMSDQHRAGLTRRSGFPLDTMPALDRLAGGGVAFDRAYTTAPLCVPARVSLLTGRWPHAHRVRQNSAARFAAFEKDLFHVCHDAGYKTGLAGKNHSHLTADRLDFWRPYMHLDGWMPDPAPPAYREFQAWMVHNNFATTSEPSPFPVEVQFPYRIVSDAIEFIDGAGQQPFALWVSFPEPHNPYQVPKPYFDLFPTDFVPPRAVGPEGRAGKRFKWQWLGQLENRIYPNHEQNWRRTRSNYLGMLRLIDDQLARLLQNLEQSGKLNNTLVVYLSDHGDFFCDYGLDRKGVDLPEVLTRIPMVWAGWKVRPQKNHPAFVSTADILPTMCEAMGAPIPRGSQGRSLWPMLQGQAYPGAEFESIYSEVGFGGLEYGPADAIDPKWGQTGGTGVANRGFDELNSVTQAGNLKMVRLGDWKLTFDVMGAGELYNVARDPYELRNLYNDAASAEVRHRLTAELLRWTIRTQDDLPVAAYTPKWPPHGWYKT